MDVFTTVRARPRLRNGLLPAASGRVQRSCWQSLSSPCRIQDTSSGGTEISTSRLNFVPNPSLGICHMPYTKRNKKTVQPVNPTCPPSLPQPFWAALQSHEVASESASAPQPTLWMPFLDQTLAHICTLAIPTEDKIKNTVFLIRILNHQITAFPNRFIDSCQEAPPPSSAQLLGPLHLPPRARCAPGT